MTWVFNDAETNSLKKLSPYNGQMPDGSPLLAATGNALNTQVGAVGMRVATFSPPGGNWSGHRTTGRKDRVIVWNWQIVAVSEAALYKVIARIEAYMQDGREYVLSDGTRSSNYAVLAKETGPRDNPRALYSGGRWMQHWSLRFLVLKPEVGVGVSL